MHVKFTIYDSIHYNVKWKTKHIPRIGDLIFVDRFFSEDFLKKHSIIEYLLKVDQVIWYKSHVELLLLNQ